MTLKIQAERLFAIFPVFASLCQRPMDNAMSVKVSMIMRKIRPIYQEIENGRNIIINKYLSRTDEGLAVLPAQEALCKGELSSFWEKLGELEIEIVPLKEADLGNLGCATSPNEIEVLAELAVDEIKNSHSSEQR